MLLVYVRKLDFQANLWKAFAEDKKQHYCGLGEQGLNLV